MNRYAYTRNNPIIYVDPSGHGFFSSLKRWFPTLLAIAVSVAVFAALPGSAVAGTGFFETVAGGLSQNALIAVGGGIAGAAGGAASGALTGGLEGALLGGAIGFAAGLAGGGAAGGVKGGLAKALVGGAVGGGVGGALSAVMSGQNVLEGAIIGGLTGAAFAAAMYGVTQLFKNAATEGSRSSETKAKATEAGEKIKGELTTKISAETQNQNRDQATQNLKDYGSKKLQRMIRGLEKKGVDIRWVNKSLNNGIEVFGKSYMEGGVPVLEINTGKVFTEGYDVTVGKFSDEVYLTLIEEISHQYGYKDVSISQGLSAEKFSTQQFNLFVNNYFTAKYSSPAGLPPVNLQFKFSQ